MGGEPVEKLKLLFITNDQSEQMEKSSYFLEEELKKLCELMIWNQGGRISDIVSQVPHKPEFILLNDCFSPKLAPYVSGLRDITIPKGIIYHDISNHIQERKKFIVKENIDIIFVHYREAFRKWYPRLSKRMIWLPHHINTNIFKDYHLDKTIEWLMLGAMSPRLYPLRWKILNSLKNEPGFVTHPHPGYKHESEIHPESLIGEAYAKEINRAKIFLTCHSIYEYPLMKYFEVLGCNTLLLAPSSKELTDLGFIDGHTFVSIDQNNFKEKATYYQKHSEERIRISNKGYSMVRQKHSTKQRANELIQHIQQFLLRKNRKE